MTVSRTITAFLALVLLTGVASAQLELQLKAGEPLRGLTPAQLAAFSLGKAQFNRTFTEAEGRACPRVACLRSLRLPAGQFTFAQS